ncbi:1-phosphofructokinase family hexose kinase [soil metagenome]
MITALVPSPALDVTYLVPTVTVGAIQRPREVRRLAGGKGFNVARAAAVLGAQVRVVAPLGGRIGELVVDLAEAEGIAMHSVPIEGQTRTCVSAVPDDGSSPTEFYEPPPELSPKEWSALAAAFADPIRVAAGSWSVLTGSLPTGPAVGEVTRMLLNRRALGDRIAIDTSGPALATLIDAIGPDLVKVNRVEAAELLAIPAITMLPYMAGQIRRRTAGMVVITDGAAGSLALDGNGATAAHPDPKPGRYGIGSGDSFLAGLLWALEGEASLEIALRAASAAGSANAGVPGAGIFDRAAFDAAFSRIRVEAI